MAKRKGSGRDAPDPCIRKLRRFGLSADDARKFCAPIPFYVFAQSRWARIAHERELKKRRGRAPFKPKPFFTTVKVGQKTIPVRVPAKVVRQLVREAFSAPSARAARLRAARYASDVRGL